ncbi:MAG: heavy metal-binding domain-containing protein [Gammaproteobacteria bacterium]
MTVSRDSPLTSLKDGQTYYFCCESCRRKFESPAQSDNKSGARYTCPMHPEIVRDSPSTCSLWNGAGAIRYC